MVANETFDLAESRLLVRARRGESDALRLLWEQHSALLWSIAEPLLGRDGAIDALRVLQGRLRIHGAGLDPRRPFKAQIAALFLELVLDRLQPRPVGGIVPEATPTRTATRSLSSSAAKLRAALTNAPAEIRLVYLFTFLGKLSSDDVARLTGWPVGDVRRARAWMAYRLMEARA